MRNLEALTGLKKGGTHRGKRSRGKGSKPIKATAQQHLATLQAHMNDGNHAGAKISALHLANALHAATKKVAPAIGDEPEPMIG